jgi:hypothetical protein
LASILEADHNQEIDFINKSRAKYHGWFQNHFVILDGGNIIIGVNGDNHEQIITEDIRNKKPPEIIAQHNTKISSLLVNEALKILWAGDYKNIFQYVLAPGNAWKVQAKYSGLDIGNVNCLSLFGNLLFAGGGQSKVCVINTADKKLLPNRIETAIKYIFSLQICVVSQLETYLTVTGFNPSYSDKKTDLFDISKFQEITHLKKVFSRPDFHMNSIRHKFNKNFVTKKLPIDDNNSSRLLK